MLPPGPPGKLRNQGQTSEKPHIIVACSRWTHVIEGKATHQQQRTDGSGAPDNKRILCRALLTNNEMIEDVFARSWNIDVASVLRAG